MTQPLITLVIPTRERADTLKHTLATALDQESQDFQIVVSDNFSQDHTREVVAAANDPRVTYVNTGRRLSMTDNFEFALDHVRGKYVIYLGDDDGLMRGAISSLSTAIARHPAAVYRWECHSYMWPINGNPPKIVSITPRSAPRFIDLRRCVDFSLRWGGLRDHLLPKAYHSAVLTSVLRQIRKRTGRAFHSLAPDLFMGYALPAIVPQAFDMGAALTVAGYSAKANSGRSQAGTAHFRAYIKEFGGYKFHPALYPDAPFLINLIQDSTLVAMDCFPEYYAGKELNFEAMWAYMIRSERYESEVGIRDHPLRSVKDLLTRRNAIRKHHQFSVAKFLFYFLVNCAIKYRSKAKIALRHVPLERIQTVPPDVRGFVADMGRVCVLD